MKKILTTFFAVLFFLTSSISWSETIVVCNILLPKLKSDSYENTEIKNNPVKWHEIIYKFNKKDKKIFEDDNEKFKILYWKDTKILALNMNPKLFNFKKIAKFDRGDILNQDIMNVIKFNRISGKLTHRFLGVINSETDKKICEEDGHDKCTINGIWTIAEYSTIDDYGCSKINRKF